MTRTDILHRARGAFLGLAVGDVLGAPVEGMRAHVIRAHFGRVEALLKLPPHEVYSARCWRLPGLHTDDTQQALALTQILIQCAGIEDAALLALWKEMLTCFRGERKAPGLNRAQGCHRGTSSRFRRRLRWLIGPPHLSPTNGAAMRVTPIALRFHRDQAARLENSILASLTTHGNPVAVTAAMAKSAAVARLVAEGPRSASDLLEHVLLETREGERLLERYPGCGPASWAPELLTAFSSMLEVLIGVHERPLPDALSAITEFARERLDDERLWATSSCALASVPTALLIACRHLGDFREGILEAIHLGGDTGTVAAMAGSVIGAAVGQGGIPSDWQREVMAKSLILAGADALVSGRFGRDWSPLLPAEIEWTRREGEERDRMRKLRKAHESGLDIVSVDLEVGLESALADLCRSPEGSALPSCDRIVLRHGGVKVALLAWSRVIQRERYRLEGSRRILGEGVGRYTVRFEIAHVWRRDVLLQNLGVELGSEVALVDLGPVPAPQLEEVSVYREETGRLWRHGQTTGHLPCPEGEYPLCGFLPADLREKISCGEMTSSNAALARRREPREDHEHGAGQEPQAL